MSFVLLLATITMGAGLLAGVTWLPDFSFMWLASDTEAMVLWREVILAGLIAMALISAVYDAWYVRAIWLVAAIGLIWAAVGYFISNPVHILDILFMLSAANCFAIASLTVAREPVEALQRWSARHLRWRHVKQSAGLLVVYVRRTLTAWTISVRIASAAWSLRRHLR